MKKALREVNDILCGAGWATTDYIDNFCCHLTKAQRVLVCIKLARLGKLYDEDKLSAPASEEEPTEGRISLEQVLLLYNL
jgi:hypothetical protein